MEDKLEVLTDKHSKLKEENERLNKKGSDLEVKVAYLESEIILCFMVFKKRGEEPGKNARKQ